MNSFINSSKDEQNAKTENFILSPRDSISTEDLILLSQQWNITPELASKLTFFNKYHCSVLAFLERIEVSWNGWKNYLVTTNHELGDKPSRPERDRRFQITYLYCTKESLFHSFKDSELFGHPEPEVVFLVRSSKELNFHHCLVRPRLESTEIGKKYRKFPCLVGR